MKSKSKGSHPVWIVASHLFRSHRLTMLISGIIFLFVYLIIGSLLSRGILLEDGKTITDIWEGLSLSPKIFLLILGIMLTPSSLSSFVSNGLTRKHVVIGITLFIVAMSIAFSIFIMASYPISTFIIRLFGGELHLLDVHFLAVLSKSMLTSFCYFGSGWIIGSAFYRFNWKLAALIACVAYCPALIMELLTESGKMREWIQPLIKMGSIGIAIQILLIILVLIGIVALNYMMLRRMPIKRKAAL